MNSDRRTLLKAIPAAASAALAWPVAEAATQVGNATLAMEPAGVSSYRPLQQVTLRISGSGWEDGKVAIIDGVGQEYLREQARGDLPFTVGGALGRQTARLLDPHGVIAAELEFIVDCSTELNDEDGVYRSLMESVLWTMMSWSQDNPVSIIHHNHRVYQFFANWVFDHTLIMKGMKYFWPDLKDAVDFFADTQREDGMIWENCYPVTPDYNFFDHAEFVRRIGGGYWQLRRAPVESHVEQFFIECLYYTWKATGDTDWMKGKLDTAMRAVHYIAKSPYRWSQKYNLMHRGFTIDTWDYVSDDQQRSDGSVFMVYLGKSEFGVFHGDNTNLILQCRNLAEMLKVAGRADEAPEFEKLADDVEERLNALAWNGSFYTHWIAENPDYKPDVGVDMSSQVSLSNAYALNRGISQEKCVAIISTYQRIRREMPSSSPGEFYGIYPPFQRDFTRNTPGLVWEYCNGGVLTVVGGELAHGAFEHGYESYGVDILLRLKAIADRYYGYLPVTLRGKAVETPERTFQPLNIRQQANACHADSAPGVPLWSGDKSQNLADLPSGRQEFQGVPFQILDPSKSPFQSCIVLSRRSPFAQHASLPVGAKAASLYLLDATDVRPTNMLVTLHYADGTSHLQDVKVRTWSFPTDTKYDKEGPRTEDTYRVAWKKSTSDKQEYGVYTTGVNNPYPEREIAALELSVCDATNRWLILAVTLSSAPVFFAPYDDLSTGIPDGWNGSVIYALLEGMAGIKDRGAAFSQTAIVPRWEAAKVRSADITVRYPASAGYCSYSYRVQEHKLEIKFTGSAERFEVQILLPANRSAYFTRLDGRAIQTTQRKIEQSSYLVLPSVQCGVHHVEVDLAP